MPFSTRFPVLLSAVLFTGFTACEYDHLEVYEEPIKSMFLVLTPENGRNRVILNYLDNDGPGGQDALVNSTTLTENTTYTAQVHLQQMLVGNAKLEHIIDTTTVMAQPELHQVFYIAKEGLQLQTEYADVDKNGNPVGLETTIRTGLASEGSLQLIIIHAPNKLGNQVAEGFVDNARGKTDLETAFNIVILPSL